MNPLIKNKAYTIVLDDEEQAISDALDQGMLKSVPNLSEEIAFAKAAAANYFKKESRVNIRISSNDLLNLKQRAAYKGIPYQTYVASILHQVAAGHFANA